MADMLATTADLALLMQQELDTPTATLLLAAATATVQAACRQRLVAVADAELSLLGTTSSWLDLPERPVTAVTTVVLDGVTLTAGTSAKSYRLFGDRLWRTCGWAECAGRPSSVQVTVSHGYADAAQDLELAKAATLSLARGAYSNPAGVAREQIDDYAVAYEAAASQMDASPALQRALRAKYGRRAGAVRL